MEQEQKRANPCYEWDCEGKKKWNIWNKYGTRNDNSFVGENEREQEWENGG